MSEKLFTHEAYQKVLQIIREPLNVYIYGSRAYGCNRADADFDFIVVTKDITINETVDHQNINMAVYSIEDFKKKIAEHEISVLECLFLPADKILKQDVGFEFVLDLKQLRRSLSEKSSNSWVKAKKKFDVENQTYIAKKSLFHSLRILMFGIQLAQHGKIVDFVAANGYWNEIMLNPATDWKTYNSLYKKIYNELKYAFKKAAPK